MNEKQIQEVMALVHAYAKLLAQGAACTAAGFDVRGDAAEARAARSALEAALREQPAAPVFEGIAKRKLDELLARGFKIDGLAIRTDEDTVVPRTRGLITTGGMVCWWTSEEEIRRIERNAAERALREQVREVPEGWKTVPVQPTDAMVQAAHHLDLSYMPGQEGADRAAIYRAMLSAAPTQPAQPPRVRMDEWMERLLSNATTPPGFKQGEAHMVTAEQVAALREQFMKSTQPAQAEQPTIRIAPAHWPMASSLEGAAHDVAKSLNECGGNNLDLRHVAMLVHHAQVSQPKAAQQEPVHQFRIRGQSSWCDGLIPSNANPEDFVARTLYTAAPQREPMTPEEVREGIANHIEDVFRAEKVWTVLQTAAYIRSIEINGRHHGIKE